jgi:hypothetical protein
MKDGSGQVFLSSSLVLIMGVIAESRRLDRLKQEEDVDQAVLEYLKWKKARGTEVASQPSSSDRD